MHVHGANSRMGVNMGEVISWLLVGLAAGGLASALTPGRTTGGIACIVAIGVAGALLGGWICLLLFGSHPSSLLGSVIVGVVGALGVLALLNRAQPGRPRF